MVEKRVQAIADHIQSTIATLNPHEGARLYTIYTQGFLLGHMASLFYNDPVLYREFLEHCETIAQKHNKKIDTHRK